MALLLANGLGTRRRCGGPRDALPDDTSEATGRGRRRDHRQDAPECRPSAADGVGVPVSAPNVLPTDHVLPGTAGLAGCGAGPPGPRRPCRESSARAARSGWALAGLLAVALVGSRRRSSRWWRAAETAVLRSIASLRTDWLTPRMRVLARGRHRLVETHPRRGHPRPADRLQALAAPVHVLRPACSSRGSSACSSTCSCGARARTASRSSATGPATRCPRSRSRPSPSCLDRASRTRWWCRAGPATGRSS